MSTAVTLAEAGGLLEELGSLLELEGADAFKTKAYASAARTLGHLDGTLAEWEDSGKLAEVKGLGKSLTAKLHELRTTGHIQALDGARARIPAGVREMLKLPGLGPVKVRSIWQELGAENLEQLQYACHENRLVTLKNFGGKTQAKVLAGIAFLLQNRDRFRRGDLWPFALAGAAEIANLPGVTTARVTGPLWRGEPIVGRIDWLASATDIEAARPGLEKLPWLSRPEWREGALYGMAEGKAPVRLALCPPAEFVARSVFESCTPEVFAAIQTEAQRAAASPGRVRRSGKAAELDSEAAYFEALGFKQALPPELRDQPACVALAARGELPALVEVADIQGAVHCHTSDSDGSASIEAMAEAAGALGLKYITITDHSRQAVYANGLDAARLRTQIERITGLNASGRFGVRILSGIEVDILADGTLDLPDEVLAACDVVIASVHSVFGQAREVMTARIARAMASPRVAMIGHPTGALLLGRPAYALDRAELVAAAARTGTALELNAHPYRLDLDEDICRAAAAAGVKVSINPDAHHPGGIADIGYGVTAARRAMLTAANIANTRDAAGFLALSAADG